MIDCRRGMGGEAATDFSKLIVSKTLSRLALGGGLGGIDTSNNPLKKSLIIL